MPTQEVYYSKTTIQKWIKDAPFFKFGAASVDLPLPVLVRAYKDDSTLGYHTFIKFSDKKIMQLRYGFLGSDISSKFIEQLTMYESNNKLIEKIDVIEGKINEFAIENFQLGEYILSLALVSNSPYYLGQTNFFNEPFSPFLRGADKPEQKYSDFFGPLKLLADTMLSAKKTENTLKTVFLEKGEIEVQIYIHYFQ